MTQQRSRSGRCSVSTPITSLRHRTLGGAFLAKGNKVGALAEFRTAVRLQPNDSFAREQLLKTLKVLRDTAGAAALQPGDELLLQLDLGQSLVDKKDFPGAVGAFRKALEREPQSAEAQRKLADALRRNGELDAAIAAFRAAIQLEPGSGFNHNNLGLALEAKGDLIGASPNSAPRSRSMTA